MLYGGYFSLAIRDNQSAETNYYFSTATNPLTQIRSITSELCLGEVIVGGCNCLQLSTSGRRRSWNEKVLQRALVVGMHSELNLKGR